MIAPSGYVQAPVSPAVQSTARPPGTLLQPSPGYDTIRLGKNQFQAKGPSGGFRPQTFAEDLGGSGAALAVIPGETTASQASEFLPLGEDVAEGTMIISDRPNEGASGYAMVLHEAYSTLPDMGDRHPDRPRTRSKWLVNPVSALRGDFQTSPAMTVAASLGLLALVHIVVRDIENGVGGYRPRGVASAVTDVPAAGASTAGNVTKDVADQTSESLKAIGDATDEAVNKIGKAADDAADKIANAA